MEMLIIIIGTFVCCLTCNSVTINWFITLSAGKYKLKKDIQFWGEDSPSSSVQQGSRSKLPGSDR